MSLTDPTIQKIRELYSLGSDGQYEIIVRTIFVIQNSLEFGKTGKECIDRMMDLGVKPLELGIALAVSLSRINPSKLNGIDSSMRCKILRENKKMLADWEELEKQNE